MATNDYRYIQKPPGWEPNSPQVEFYGGRLPERETVERIFQLHREGKTFKEIGLILTGGRSKHMGPRRALAERIITEGISKWDWVDDEVAIQRAYMGDREVWLNLTHYERNVLLEKLSLHTEENPHPLASGIRRSFGQKRGDNIADSYIDTEAAGSSSINGYVEWAFSVGEEPQRIIQNMSKRKQRRHQRNYAARRDAA